ncbi:MAG: acetate/propionate family kinase, partial [Synergistaceae bacterium]|nr:acetate/propionate family kinase [Synergistaceae bacterium]
MMKILVINCGSSSLKYQLFDMSKEKVLAKGLVERIGIEGSRIKHVKTGLDAVTTETSIPDHRVGIRLVLDALLDKNHGVLASLDEISAVGHRVVHAGEKFSTSVKLDSKVLDALRQCIPLAPLHNPANLMGIDAVTDVLPKVPQVGVFDTAFHQTMPPNAFIYGVPYGYYEKYGVRRYGFHGTSHYYVAHRAAEMLGRPLEKLKIVTCHLGNGSSITAVNGGKSVDTSMGFTPLAGVLMGTRCGDVDPALVAF